MRGAAAACLLAAIASQAPAPAGASPSSLPLGKVSILYDTANWKAAPNGQDGITFTCVAEDCAARPQVFASLSSQRDISADLAVARRSQRPLHDDDAAPLPFAAIAYGSGCRATDAPVLFAGGQIGQETYRFSTAITLGCNFNPPLPEARFLELLHGLQY